MSDLHSPSAMVASFKTADELDFGIDDNGRFYVAVRHSTEWLFITFFEDGTYCVSE